VLWRKAVLIPLQRVQHVSISQGPLQKRFGLATLKVYTAGGLDAEASLADIEHQLAQALSEQLSRLIPRGETDAEH
jgi:membrane protein YdbS with pleckstrin-like domain